jgi:hypothetical protein
VDENPIAVLQFEGGFAREVFLRRGHIQEIGFAIGEDALQGEFLGRGGGVQPPGEFQQLFDALAFFQFINGRPAHVAFYGDQCVRSACEEDIAVLQGLRAEALPPDEVLIQIQVEFVARAGQLQVSHRADIRGALGIIEGGQDAGVSAKDETARQFHVAQNEYPDGSGPSQG